MQKPQPRDDFGRIEFGARLRKPAAHLDVEHEIAAVQVLHDEKQMALRTPKVLLNIN